MDPRHKVIIELVKKFKDLGYDKEASDLREKAAAIETFPQLDALHQYCLRMLDFIER
jgi:hypothetical protein